jgi:uncharacterized protein (TIGR02453 family)
MRLSPTVFTFLRELALNNNRPWLDANRNKYEAAKSEAELLVGNCITALAAIVPIGNPEPRKCMFRIYRDVRFSKNKEPFKRNFSALISSGGRKPASIESWYLHLEPGKSFMAAGVYEPTGDELSRIRQEIEYNSTAFLKILNEPSLNQRFGQIQGNRLKTAPRNYPKDHPMIEFIRLTQYYLMVEYRDEDVFHSGFPEQFAEDCRQVLPFLQFLGQALS